MRAGKRVVLAIDDQITILNSIRLILEGSFEVSLAKNAEMAKAIMETAEIDVILLDLEMPDCPGLELLSIIRQDPACYHIPVIVVSSHGQMETIIQAKKSGANDFVVKPINEKVLIDRVYATLKTSAQKISRDGLLRKLKSLELHCAEGKSALIEKSLEEFENVYYNLPVDTVIVSMYKYAKALDYKSIIEKIHFIITLLKVN